MHSVKLSVFDPILGAKAVIAMRQSIVRIRKGLGRDGFCWLRRVASALLLLRAHWQVEPHIRD